MFIYYLYETINLIRKEYNSYYQVLYDAIVISNNYNLKSCKIDIVLNNTGSSVSPIIIDTLIFTNENLTIRTNKKIYNINNNIDFNIILDLYLNSSHNEHNKYLLNNIYKLLKKMRKEKEAIKEQKQEAKQEAIKEPKQEAIKETKQEPFIELKKIKDKIKKLENAKQIADSAIIELEDGLENEEKELEKCMFAINNDKKVINKVEDNLKKDLSIYLSDKEFTYKKIYNNMMKYGGIDFEKIPSLFISKFPVFLFMDGKDCKGNTVSKSLLELDNVFTYNIYTMLYNALTNDDYNLEPENETDENIELISDFMNFLPANYRVITQSEIMESLNDKDNSITNNIFKEDITEHEECDIKEDNNNYIMQ